MLQIRVATCLALPEPDPDEARLRHALERAGIRARLCAWDDPDVDWVRQEPTIIRSTWNYHHSPAAFLDWVDHAARSAPLWNAPALIRANVHKRYLLELPRLGVEAVPTELVSADTVEPLPSILARRAWSKFVIKPSISAGSFGTRRFQEHEREAAQQHLEQLLLRGEALIQPYLSSVEHYGERCLVWIDGEFTHAVRKAPRFAENAESISGPLEMNARELEVASAALRAWQRLAPSEAPLYARVDLVRDELDRPVVAEIELIEPSLFFEHSPRALERLIAGLLHRLR